MRLNCIFFIIFNELTNVIIIIINFSLIEYSNLLNLLFQIKFVISIIILSYVS